MVFDFNTFEINLKELKNKFEARFKDFEIIKSKMGIFYTPMTCSIFDQAPEFQMELCDLQCDINLKINTLTGIEFWKNVDFDKYPLLHNEIQRTYSMFGSTYICESAFSTLKLIKIRNRSRLTNFHLEALLKLSLTNLNINIDNLLDQF